MVSVLAFYQSGVDPVAQMLKSRSSQLGFRLLRPFEMASESGWDRVSLRNTRIFTDLRSYVRADGVELTCLEFFSSGAAYRRFEELFQRLLQESLSPLEALVLDHDAVCSGPCLTYSGDGRLANEVLRGMETCLAAGVHQLRAFRLDTLVDIGAWERAAVNCGLSCTQQGPYLMVNLGWELRGRPGPRSASMVLPWPVTAESE